MYSSDTSQQRRDETLKKLNDYYGSQIGAKNMKSIYNEMVDIFSYRLLSLFTYSKTPTPVRKHRYFEIPPETDVSNYTSYVRRLINGFYFIYFLRNFT